MAGCFVGLQGLRKSEANLFKNIRSGCAAAVSLEREPVRGSC